MKNLSVLEVVNSVNLNIESLFDLVDIYGLKRAVEIQAKMGLFYAVKDSDNEYLKSMDPVRLVNNLYKIHRFDYENQAQEIFEKEYK
ncbi:hypothetical protein N9165_00335 [Akkermansiaceae bacterium]|nr:hypothetical protein [Akkermansiaceae bacterium]